MQDQPDPVEILKSVSAFLRDTVIPETGSHTAFKARVAANALDLVGRHIGLSAAADVAEAQRLRELLGREDTLENLNAALAAGIATGALGAATPGLAAHLWLATLEKLAIDQPNYSGYRAALDEKPPAKIGES